MIMNLFVIHNKDITKI